MNNKLTNKQLSRIDASIADRKAFREWWDDITRRMPYYGSPENQLIAWAAWEACRERSAVSKKGTKR